MFGRGDYIALLPETILALGALFLLIEGVVSTRFSRSASHIHCVLILLLAQLALIMGHETASSAPFGGLFVNDNFGEVCRSLILLGTTLLLVLSHDPDRRLPSYELEFHVLALFVALGMMVMVSASNFLVLYLGMELQALAFYVLVGIRRNIRHSVEAGLKFFVLSGVASLLFLYGVSLFYGLSGSLSYDVLASSGEDSAVTFRVASLLVLSALAFKLAAAPFHVWAPDVYQGSSMRVLSLLATVSKVVAVAVFLRLLQVPLQGQLIELESFLLLLSLLSLTVGSLGGLWQRNIKRLLAYSGISQMGFALLGTLAWQREGFEAMFVYIVIYFLTMLGVFAILLSLSRKQRQITELADLAGLAKSHGGYALALALFMFSLIGLPPFAGFFAKLYVFFAAIERGYVYAVIWAAMMSVVAAGYYLRVIKVMYMDTAERGVLDKRIHIDNRFIVFLVAVFTLGFVFVPRSFWDLLLSLWASVGA